MNRLLFALLSVLLVSAGPPGNPAVVRAQSLDAALSFKERPAGRNDTRSAMHHPATVDFESLLIIEPDTSLLKTLGGADEAVLPPLSDIDRARLESLPALLAAAHAYVDEAAQVVAAVGAARRGGGLLLSDAAVDSLQQRIARQATLALTIQDPVLAIAEARARDLHPTDPTAAERAFIAMTDPLFMDAEGRAVLLNVSAFEAFLREHLGDAERHIQADTETAARQGTTRFRMRAWLLQPGKEPVAISIAGYDDIEDLAGLKRPRVTFRLTPREQERLAQGLALSAVAATFITDVRDTRSSLRTGLENLKQTALQDLNALRDLPADLLSDVDSTLQVAVDHALAFTASPDTLNHLTALNGFLGAFKTNLTTIQTAVDELKAGTASPDALVQQALALPTTSSDAIQFTIGYAREVKTNRDRLEMLEVVLQKPAARRPFTARVMSLLPGTKQALDAFATEELAPYVEAVQLVKGLLNSEQIVHLGDALDDVSVDARVRTMALDDVAPGTITLAETPADRGDRIEVRAELLTVDAAGEDQVLDTAARTFHVQRFGLTSDVTSHLIFTDRAGIDSTGVDPATSASWTLHVRPRTGPEASALAKAWAFLDPGFGINAAALNFDGGSLEIGLGAHVSLFDDLLSAGYGYNLLADADPTYYYLGIGLLEVLSRF